MKTTAVQRLFTLSALILALTCGINAATWTVTKASDSSDGVCDSDCSLREAVAAASANDSINFLKVLGNAVLTLNGEEIIIDKTISISGLGAKSLTISGNLTSRIFLVETGSALKLTDITLTRGNGVSKKYYSGFGGAICTESGASLILDRVNLHDNHAALYVGAVVLQEGVHRITNTSITNNSATSGTALSTEAHSSVYLINVTVSGNFDSDGGEGAGAIINSGASGMIIRNSTIVNNNAGSGGGIFTAGGQIEIGNSIVAGNSAQTGADILFNYFGVVSVGGNLIGNLDTVPGGVFTRPNDATNINPLLAPLGFYGGDVRVHALGIGSPARDAGINANAFDPFDNTPLTTDARGAGFSRIVNNTVDKGSLESSESAAIGGRVLSSGGRGVANARVRLTGQSGEIYETRTNPLGYYSFRNIQVGQSFVAEVFSKSHRFAPQNLDVFDQIFDFDFTALP